MSTTKSIRAFKWFDELELSLCVFFNRAIDWRLIRLFFVAISRLGNGVFWYTLMILMAVYDYPNGIQNAAQMGAVGLVCVIIYKSLKNNLVRQRPYISWQQITSGTAPLDMYSFPSGHTLHAVAFCIVATAQYPILGWLLIPFTVLIALSRVILGLHYPTDVVVGAIIGGLVAWSSFFVF